jgi:hypothetical protein
MFENESIERFFQSNNYYTLHNFLTFLVFTRFKAIDLLIFAYWKVFLKPFQYIFFLVKFWKRFSYGLVFSAV